MSRIFSAQRSPRSVPLMEQIEDRTLFSTFLVTTTASTGTGSFRDAITKANKNSGADVIQFKIGTGAKTITPTSALPHLSGPTVIDATTQPGFAGKPLIEIRGGSAGGYGIVLAGGNSTVKGLIINRWSSDGILITNQGWNVIKGNYIGTDAAGTYAAGNKGKGIVVTTANNVIGGLATGDRNVISGNSQGGIQFWTTNAHTNKVQGNYIGTDATGSKAVGNLTSGVAMNTAPGNLIGGSMVSARNVISGNKQDGVVINQSGATGNVVQGNYIGLNAAGSAAIGNEWYGVETSQKNTLITGNVISGNKYSGVVLWLASGSYNKVTSNLIGTDATGMKKVGNLWRGVDVSNGSSYNTIGGPTTAERNVISGNGQNGVTVYQGTTNLFQNNYIGFGKDGATAIGNNGDGFRLVQTAKTTIKTNLIGNNTGYAVHNGASTGTVVTGNTLVNDILFLVKAI